MLTFLVLVLVTLTLAALLRSACTDSEVRSVHALIAREVDMSKLPDGDYVSAYRKGSWTYDVEVTVRNHRLVALTTSNPRSDTPNAADADDNLGAEVDDVDVVSGATLNTKAYGKVADIARSLPAQS
ncbi:MAG: hypothetical protein RL701_7351 [Pseudomonadota bacterium]